MVKVGEEAGEGRLGDALRGAQRCPLVNHNVRSFKLSGLMLTGSVWSS